MTDGTPITRVRILFEDSQQNLWVGTNSNGLLVFDKGTVRTVPEETAASIRDICEGADGTIYIASSDGIKRVRKDYTVEPIEDSRVKCLVISLTADKDGTIWGVTFNGDVFFIQAEAIVAFYPKETFQNYTCISAYSDSLGRLILGTTGNAIVVKQGSTFQLYPTGSEKNITSLYEDGEHRLWVCSDTGMGFFDSSMSYTTASGSIFSASLEHLFQDYEHNYWVASSRRGLLRLIRSKFHNITFDAGLRNDVFNATQQYKGNLFLGAEKGLFILDGQGNSQENDLTTLLKDTRIRDFLTDSKGNLWIATYKTHGVIRYDGSQWKNWTTKDGLTNEKVRCFLERTNGDMVIGTGDGFSIIRDDTVIKSYGLADGLTNGVILSLLEDDDQCILAGSDGDGIYVISPDNTIKNLDRCNDGTKIGTVLRMEKDQQGTIWISNGSGLLYLDKGIVHTIDSGGIDLTNIFDMKIIGDRIWLLRQTGIFIISRDNLKKSDFSSYSFLKYSDTSYSMLTANSKNMLTDQGYLYLSCSRGVLGIDTQHIYNNSIPPKIVINSISVNDKNLDGQIFNASRTVTIPNDADRVTIRFSVMSLTDQETQMEYRLEGYDENPVTVKGKNYHEATYTNLKGGNYTLHIRAWNGDGVVSEQELILPIKKEYTVLEYPAVRGLCAILGLLFLYFGGQYYVRIKTMRRVKKAEDRQKEYQTITNEAILSIANTIDAKDKYTNGHSRRVAKYAKAIASELGWPKNRIEKIYYTALLHDIGKIGIPDHILNKSGKLTGEEYAVIKTHTTIGYHILENMEIILYIKDGAYYHHERYDGKGYPVGLKGKAIPLVAHIICVADSFDAMYSKRIYRDQFDIDYIINELRCCSGTQFDPEISKVMLTLLLRGDILKGTDDS